MIFNQPSFAKGEVGPEVFGRVDIQSYASALKTAYNCIIHPYGGVSNRPGTKFIGPVKVHNSPVRIIPFQFKTTDSYILEFGNQYMRVIRNDQHVTETPLVITLVTTSATATVTIASHGFTTGQEVYIDNVVGMPRLNQRRFVVGTTTTNTFQILDQVTNASIDTTGYGTYVSGGTGARIYTVASPYSASDLGELKYVQNADTMTFTHRAYPVYQLTRADHTSWTFAQAVFAPSIARPSQLAVTVGTAGSTTYSYKVTALKVDTLEESLPGLNSLTGITISAVTQANPAVVTANAHGFSSGQEVVINSVVGMTQLNGNAYIVGGVTTNQFELANTNSTAYNAYVSGGTVAQTFITVTNSAVAANNTIGWFTVAGAVQYKVYKFQSGNYGLIGQTPGTSFLDSNITPSAVSSIPITRAPFATVDPIGVSYYQQRRVFGGSNAQPDTQWYTQTGNTSNFNAAQPTQQNDAFNTNLTSNQVNEIRHFVPLTSLLVFTSGAEWRVDAGLADHFGFDTVKQQPQSEWGSSHIRPITINGTVLFIPDNRRHVRTLGYSYTTDKYTGDDLTVLAPHLLKYSQMKEWAYGITDDSRIYAVRDDGIMLTLTFDQEQEVVAWTRCETDGLFESVACIKNPSTSVESEDAIYFVVSRMVNGNNVQYVERLVPRLFQRIEDAYFVDCGLSYDNPINIASISLTNPCMITSFSHGFTNGQKVNIRDIVWQPNIDKWDGDSQPKQLNDNVYVVSNVTTDTFTIAVDATAFNAYKSGGVLRHPAQTFSSLDMLEGKNVVALADGNVLRNLTVVNGSITLDAEYSTVHIGLPYTSDIETMDIQQGQQNMQGRIKKISKLWIRFQDSRGIVVGPSDDPKKLTEMKWRQFENYGQPTQMVTGLREMTEYSEWNNNGRIFLRQKDPLPMTILALMPDVILDDPQ